MGSLWNTDQLCTFYSQHHFSFHNLLLPLFPYPSYSSLLLLYHVTSSSSTPFILVLVVLFILVLSFFSFSSSFSSFLFACLRSQMPFIARFCSYCFSFPFSSSSSSSLIFFYVVSFSLSSLLFFLLLNQHFSYFPCDLVVLILSSLFFSFLFSFTSSSSFLILGRLH